MNKYIKLAAVALGALALGACTEDKINDIDVADLPTVSQYADNFVITVDQATNTANFEFNGVGVYPVWIIDGKSYSSQYSFSRFYRKAGEYKVEVKVGNANGISLGAVEKVFTIDKTQMTGFGGFNYEYEHNLWRPATKKAPTFFYAPGWSQIADPAYSFDGDAYTVTLPEATTDQLQAQMHIGTDICLAEGNHYDGSVIFTSNVDIKSATLKIHSDGDDDDAHSFFPAEKITLTAGEPRCFWFSDLPAAVDMNNVVFTLDFGGNPAGAEIIIENVVLKDHQYDDGTVLPELPAVGEPVWVDAQSADNLWHGLNPTIGFYYAPGWAQIPDPELTVDGESYSIVLPAATTDQWQAQMFMASTLSLPDSDSAGYDFCVSFDSNIDIPGVTVKLTAGDSDDNFFFAERVAVTGGVTKKFWIADVKSPSPMPDVKLVLDFGGNADGTKVTISNIILQKHHD